MRGFVGNLIVAIVFMFAAQGNKRIHFGNSAIWHQHHQMKLQK